MSSRLATSALLLAVIIPSLTTLTASPQQATTYTSTVAFTTVMTATSLSVGTSYATSVQQQYLYSGPFTLDSRPAQYGCFFFHLPFEAKHGDEIKGSLSSDIAVSFYVMTENFYRSWHSSGAYCDVGGTPVPSEQLLISREAITSISLDFTIDKEGKYQFLFLNFNTSKDANINFDVGVAGSITTVTAASVISSQVTQLQVVTSTGLTLLTAQSFPIGGNIWLVVLAVVLVLGIAAIVTYRKRSARQRRGITQAVEAPVPSDKGRKSGEMFCKECGAKITRDSKFCKECGTKQP